LHRQNNLDLENAKVTLGYRNIDGGMGRSKAVVGYAGVGANAGKLTKKTKKIGGY